MAQKTCCGNNPISRIYAGLHSKAGKRTKSGKEKLTVQYQLDNRDNLSRYLSELAPKMREEGIHLFQAKFFADRRIFEVQEIISK
nr:DUF4286 family protein [Legionella pneumophila]